MTRKRPTTQVKQFGQLRAIRELEVTVSGPRQILMKTEARGVCHTDLHAQDGDWPLKPHGPSRPATKASSFFAGRSATLNTAR